MSLDLFSAVRELVEAPNWNGDTPERIQIPTEVLVDVVRAYRADEAGTPPPTDSPLRRWWIDDAHDQADRTIAKMEEYGSGDLVALGQTMRRLANRPPFEDLTRAMELGCLMYLLGKIERAVEAVAADREVKDDTWFDAEVYTKMARAARAGKWEIAQP